MSLVTCKESIGTHLAWHVKSDTSRVKAKSDKPKGICQDWKVKCCKSRVTNTESHVKSEISRVTFNSYMSRVASKKRQVKSVKSRVTSRELQVKSDMLWVACQEGHFKSDKSRMKSQKWQVKEWLPKSGMLKATSYDKFWPFQTGLLRLATWHLQILASKL